MPTTLPSPAPLKAGVSFKSMRIVEIGGGWTPFFMRYYIKLSPHTHYSLIERDEAGLRRSREKITHSPEYNFLIRQNQVCFHLLPNSSHLDRSISEYGYDEAVLSNVLSAPLYQKISTSPADEDEQKHLEVNKKILDHALALVKPGGSVRVYTDIKIYGPRAWHSFLKSPDYSWTLDEQETNRLKALNTWKLQTGTYEAGFKEEALTEPVVYTIIK